MPDRRQGGQEGCGHQPHMDLSLLPASHSCLTLDRLLSLPEPWLSILYDGNTQLSKAARSIPVEEASSLAGTFPQISGLGTTVPKLQAGLVHHQHLSLA